MFKSSSYIGQTKSTCNCEELFTSLNSVGGGVARVEVWEKGVIENNWRTHRIGRERSPLYDIKGTRWESATRRAILNTR